MGWIPGPPLTAADMAPFKKPFEDWRDNVDDNGYDAYIASITASQQVWVLVEEVAALLAMMLYGRYTGGLNPSMDDQGHSLGIGSTNYIPGFPANDVPAAFVMNVDYGVIPDQPKLREPDISSELETQVAISNAVRALWITPEPTVPPTVPTPVAILNVSTSPVCKLKIYFPNNPPPFNIEGIPLGEPIVTLSTDARGAVSTKGEVDSLGRKLNAFYLLTTTFDVSIYGFGSLQVPENLKITMRIDDDNFDMFRYPSYVEYAAHAWDLVGHEIKDTALKVSVSGRLRQVPTSFGGSVKPAVWNGAICIDEGGPQTTYISEARLRTKLKSMHISAANINKIIAQQDVVNDQVQDPFTWCGEFMRTFSKAPPAFGYFAGAYYDHPIVTEVDNGTPTSGGMADLVRVNNYVNSAFTPLDDPSGKDYWKFMGPWDKSGDCEDFALTKIQMLLNGMPGVAAIPAVPAGPGGVPPAVPEVPAIPAVLPWSIASLQLVCGRKTPESKTGHTWVLVNGTIALTNPVRSYTSGAVTTHAFMKTLYPVDVVIQRGLTWTLDGGSESFVTIPWPFDDFNMPLMTLNAQIQKIDE